MRTHKYFVPSPEAVKIYPDGREVCNRDIAEGKHEYDSRRYQMEVRQGFRCAICERIASCMMQFDHQDGRGHGGGNRDDRIEVEGKWFNAALCHMCNTEKGSKRYQWLNGKYVPVSREVNQREVA